MTTLTATPACQSPRIWGLSARDLHDAYWRARGVQWLRRGEPEALDRAAEFFLLTEPGQLVLFDLSRLSDRLIWRDAAVTRLRVADQEADVYSERVVADEHGAVQRIERRYRPRVRASYRVMLTPSPRIARLWTAASTRRQGWDDVRRSVSWARIDNLRWPGGCFTEGVAEEERDLISRLVACWKNPDQVIDGLESAGDGVWKRATDTIDERAMLVGPLWVGDGGVADENACLVGPAWTADQARVGATVRVRRIGEVEVSGDRPGRRRRAGINGYALAKRGLDIVASAVTLLLLLPVFGLVALGILIEDGRPVFYAHVRQTRHGKLFRCWKFRTMCRNADKLTAELAAANRCDGPQVFIEGDPRVTRVGAVLRRTYIDELPQFWNALIGQMSVVGPRPSPDDENQYCPAWRDERLSVRPGITGLWQLRRTRAPGEDFQEWIKYDIEYVRQASFRSDLSIIAQTVLMLVLGRRR